MNAPGFLETAAPASSPASRGSIFARLAPLAAWGPRAHWSLPFDGLPAGIGELPAGGLSLLLAQDDGSRSKLLRSLLTNALPMHRVTWVCAPGATPRELPLEVRQAAKRHQLLAFCWTREAAGQLEQLGAAHLLHELTFAGMRPNDLLVIDALTPWLTQLPVDCALEALVEDACSCLLRMAAHHRGPVLALAPAHVRGQSLLPLLAASSVVHLAAFDLGNQAPHLDVVRWSSNARTRAAKPGARLRLEAGPEGRWHCREKSPIDVTRLLAAADAHTTHAQRGALLDASSTPENWRVHASLESLLEVAHGAVAATIVLAHESPEDLASLADAVYRLRREHPRLLKIIIRETGATLRKNGELALLRIGANAVVGRQKGFGHLVQVVKDVREQPFAKSPHIEPAQALQALSPDPVQGYLATPVFCNAVERMLERTADTALEHSLVHVPLLPHVAHLDALLACHCRRDGDVVTADAQGLSLFLFGCAPDDAMAALDALFAIPPSELARMVQIEADGTNQRQHLAQLRRTAEHAPLDFSTMLRGVSPTRASAPVQAVVLPTRSAEAARCVQAHVLPLRAAAA
ncbi:MAG TPA: BcsE family c-di-GMP-binding protein [Burkholderiaceae bacterium]|nr:BcsE family c-di-GMP-binding protein [Burkholderiaceae bacterium]